MASRRYSENPMFRLLGLATVVVVLIGGFAVIPSYGQTRTTTTVLREPFEIGGQPLCGGEDVQFSGTMNLVVQTTALPDGTYQSTIQHINYQNVQGTTTSGDRVIVAEVDNYGNARQISENQIMTVIHGTLVTQGKGTNTVFTQTIHLITNANGQVTANVDRVVTQCVG
jgi:hypothetical protein